MPCFVCLLLLPVLFTGKVQAQDAPVNWLHYSGGYGAETRYGNSGFVAGFGYTRMLNKIDVSLTGSCLMLGTQLKAAQMAHIDAGNTTHYTSWFFTPAIGYHLTGHAESPLLLRLTTGLGLRFYNYALPVNATAKTTGANGADAKYALVSSSDCSFYLGLHADVRLAKDLLLGVFADTYSNEKIGEHVLPGLRVSVGW